MARYAMVDANGAVVNVIEWDGDTATWQPPDGVTMVEDPDGEAGLGFTYVDGEFIPPESPPPPEPGSILTALEPTTAFIGSADQILYCIGDNFTDASVVVINGSEQVTTFVSATQVTTVIQPSRANKAFTIPITIRTGDQESTPQRFTFVAPA